MDKTLTNIQKTMIISIIFILSIIFSLLNYFNLFFILLILSVLFLNYKKIISLLFVTILLCTAVFGIYYNDFRIPVEDYLAKISPTTIVVKGRVVSLPEVQKHKSKFEFKVFSYKKGDTWNNINSKTLVQSYKTDISKIKIGDILEIKGEVKKPHFATNPGEFDYQKFLNNKNIFTIFYLKKINSHAPPSDFFWKSIQNLNNLREKIILLHKKHIPSPKIELLGGIVFGDTAVAAPESVEQDFIHSGLSHLIAASGMNVGFIFAVCFLICSILKIPYKPTIVFSGALVLLYAAMTGFPPSITRATLMLEFILLGKFLDRKSDNLMLLILVCVLLVLYNPRMLTDVGFQLSFLVTFGLLFTLPLMEKIIGKTNEVIKIEDFCVNFKNEKIQNFIKKTPEYIVGIITMPIIAQIWAFPIQVFHFNSFALYSLFANILAVPTVGIISVLGFSGSILSLIPFIGEQICFLFDKISDPLLGWVLYISNYYGNMDNSLILIRKPEVIEIIIFYLFIILITLAVINKFQLKCYNISSGITVILLIFTVYTGYFPNNLQITFFDVGQGDSTLIKTPRNQIILIDTGNKGRYSKAKYAIVPYLQDLGVKKINSLILTHTDSDHIGGTIDVLENFPVENIYTTEQKNDSQTYEKIEQYLLEKSLNTKIAVNNQEILTDENLKIKIFIRSLLNNSNQNDDSIMVHVDYRNFSTLIMADNEADSMDFIKNYIKNPVNLLRVGHHGGKNSVNEKLLAILNPQTAVISVGKNGYGHPGKRTLSLLKQRKIGVYRTDEDFAVTIKTNGKTQKIETFNEKNK
ncbi:MAG: DNA internalization-related competence protein ComEC/Rec2 [Candidatus Gastranaerophilales bacterium]|nr:DNA internalization-related competence protein ComEC/Rec2 [Candidatus Gastranaerophilales bacterium]